MKPPSGGRGCIIGSYDLRRLLPEAMVQAAIDAEQTIVRRRGRGARIREHALARRIAAGVKQTPRTWTCRCGRHHKRLGLSLPVRQAAHLVGLACPLCGDRP